mmetsp:Transcript_21141/g.36289  ORF Transcript_21141/g.36289 Transcript_21141/m.36289 type:complete len:368 (+) Transcript_21141:100-1203(+)|eukprot:CAMPEP_0196660824 /NCGR_PEP_ID=MMETSP1086-20130531/41459_1 /TAXON_ID=77921 /ORGANISM="Cyanoptyche  gloeocystis , Strain SAG4.97" /LENGTH=367 /DNA_ID=CAMNT_0041995441 /DNA_START=100 /DNA_END=1203 /DNA_ORIENTATION=-
MDIGNVAASSRAAVVFDIGTNLTKIGFAGERAPRFIIKTDIPLDSPELKVISGSIQGQQQWENYVEPFLSKLFLQLLLLPNDRPLVLVENFMTPYGIREAIARVLFERLQVPSILFAWSDATSLYCSRETTGLVLDVGHSMSRAMPIFEGQPLHFAYVCTPLGFDSITQQLKRLLAEQSPSVDLTGPGSDDIAHEVVVQTCFVQSFQGPRDAPPVRYRLPKAIVKLSAQLRQSAPEVLLQPPSETLSLPELVLDSLLKCDMVLRAQLANNLIFAGGTFSIPGLGARVFAEIEYLLTTEKYSTLQGLRPRLQVANIPFSPNLLPWLGGSIVGSLQGISQRFLSREMYVSRNGTIPDWSAPMYEYAPRA